MAVPRARSGVALTARLRIDRTRCAGHGICVLFAGRTIDLDAWGFPEVGEATIEPHALPPVRRAIASCPRQALSLEELPSPVGRLRTP